MSFIQEAFIDTCATGHTKASQTQTLPVGAYSLGGERTHAWAAQSELFSGMGLALETQKAGGRGGKGN